MARQRRGTGETRAVHTGEARAGGGADVLLMSHSMSSSSSDEDSDALDFLQLLNFQQHRRYWVHPLWLKKGRKYGIFDVLKDLNMYPSCFQNFYRMSQKCFYIVLEKVKAAIQRKATNWRQPICPEERLLITFRYYATGCSFKALSFYFLKGHSTVQSIVHETSQVLWQKLQPEYMPTPSAAKWEEISHHFYELWNLPNCVGSVDGKHIRIKAPPSSGSAFMNYKGFFSVVLLAVADADGLFVTVDIGEYGRNSDGRSFQNSNFGRALQDGRLNLPDPVPLPGDTTKIPFYFVADEAFPLRTNLMKPFSRNQLTNNRIIFNSRLSRGRKSVECAFGMLTSKHRALNSPLICNPSKVDVIVQAMCVLQNVIRNCDGTFTAPIL